VSFITLALTVITSYMGLPEFGVQTAADVEVLHELTFEPAHNHMGKLRPVPFDQLVVGAYTTRQIAAGEEDAAQAVAAFNAELEQTGGQQDLLRFLATQHLEVPTVRFNAVPADAPRLHHVLQEFTHLLDKNHHELHNAWGAIIITQDQADLKRIDVVIEWDEVELEGGRPVLDSSGNPIVILGEDGSPVRRINAAHIFIHQNSAYFD
jgi:hypothetical protein